MSRCVWGLGAPASSPLQQASPQRFQGIGGPETQQTSSDR